ncbi:MAG: hypothetical protein CVT98_03635 [Bacteroidetes bacterium HGW-Bacteroidetes-15]|nr:MAG: hypothetical protein CVT98_03635 [Bacteroidetes bacterium HGW-Bacteroidetes-15]
METIDKRVEKVLEIENKKKTQIEKDSINKIFVFNPYIESVKPEYTITPIDTIGKNIYFNTLRR